jgi:hypothetical protein
MLRPCTGSIPDGVIWIFHLRNSYARTMAVEYTQVLTITNSRSISWAVKVASTLGWQHYHLHVPFTQKFWECQTPAV